ncbi:hypothetical protein FQN57_003613 [Myotisia sp. PD_48]|nr:hypothetical protein FQN57_003613 [Myotisia sp. PD_48]
MDGLWFYLRPSFSRLLLDSPPLRVSNNNAFLRWRRSYSFRSHGPEESQAQAAHASPFHARQPPKKKSPNPLDPVAANRTVLKTRAVPELRRAFRKQKLPSGFRKLTDHKVEDILQRMVRGRPNHGAALEAIRELIQERSIRPNSSHYLAMILANTDAAGSAPEVQLILDDMEEHGIVADSGILHAALRVLAIHPDYLLRQEILEKFKDAWVSVTPSGWNDIVLGQIREGQLEMALQTLEHMNLQQIKVEEWLYSILLYNLVDYGQFDEILNVVQAKVEAGQNLSPNLWHHILDTSSADMHEELTQFIWNEHVVPGYLNPPYGVCSNVLAICSRTGNTKLATSVFKILGDRGATFALDDYEALIDTYVTAGDIDSAFRVLCTISQATSVGVYETSTRSLLSHFLTHGTDPMTVWETLQRLQREEKLDIPRPAANVVLEVCAHQGRAEAASKIYREFHTVCSAGAATSTFNHLIDACRKPKDATLAAFFVQEMVMMKHLPNRETYENLILLCVDTMQYEAACDYLLEMTGSGFALQEATKQYIRDTCGEMPDDKHAKLLRYDAAVRQPISRKTNPFPAMEFGPGTEVLGEADHEPKLELEPELKPRLESELKFFSETEPIKEAEPELDLTSEPKLDIASKPKLNFASELAVELASELELELASQDEVDFAGLERELAADLKREFPSWPVEKADGARAAQAQADRSQ